MNVDACVKLSMIALMALGIIAVFANRWRVKNKDWNYVGFSIRSIQFLAVTFVIPTIVILALSGQLDKPTLGTLLGTVVGYVLSGLGDASS
jgi:hypothetical protein